MENKKVLKLYKEILENTNYFLDKKLKEFDGKFISKLTKDENEICRFIAEIKINIDNQKEEILKKLKEEKENK